MIGGPVEELDEISKSAISELCNMIVGNASTLFSKKNMFIEITPPTTFTGNDLEVSVHKSLVLNIPILFDTGEKMEIDISYEKNKNICALF